MKISLVFCIMILTSAFPLVVHAGYEPKYIRVELTGHQSYRIHGIWASTPEDIIRLMKLNGWDLGGKFEQHPSSIVFYNQSHGPLRFPIEAIRWESQ